MKTRRMTRPRFFTLAAVMLSAAWALSSTPLLADGNPSVTGGGQYFGPFGHIDVSVNAIQHSDGSVSGHFHQRNLDNGRTVDGTVNCLYFVTGNTAVVSGVLTNTQNIPAGSLIQPGDPFALAIVDNGEGAGASPDAVTPYLYYLVGTTFDCSDPGLYQVLLQPVPLSAGNFQVSP